MCVAPAHSFRWRTGAICGTVWSPWGVGGELLQRYLGNCVWSVLASAGHHGNACVVNWAVHGTCSCTWIVQNGAFGAGSGLFWYDLVHCSYRETSLTQCTSRGLQGDNCAHSEDVESCWRIQTNRFMLLWSDCAICILMNITLYTCSSSPFKQKLM